MKIQFAAPTLAILIAASAQSFASAENWVVYPGGKGPGKGKHVVMSAGDEEYRSEESFPMLGKLLSQRHGFKCTVLFSQDENGEINPDNQTNIPGMHLLDTADLIVLGLRFRELPDKDMKHFVDYVDSGKPILGTRTSTHAFNYSRNKQSPYAKYSFNNREWRGGFGQQVLGDTWISHHGHHKRESTRGVVHPPNKNHPILNGVDDVWGPTDVYGIRKLPKDATVLLYGQVLSGMSPTDSPVDNKKNKPMMPVFWTKEHQSESGKTSKIVCTTMGSSTDFESEGLRRAVINSVYWTLGLDVPKKANAEVVGEFKPTPYGFRGYTKGVKPADHAS